MKKTAALIALCLLASAAGAIELSLEENRGERGSVGFVDIQRLFADSPDAQRAKEGFEDLVRQAEERVNLRKAELLKLHHELDATRAERDALALALATIPSPSTAAAPTPAEVAPSTAPLPSPEKPRELALPGMPPMSPAPTAPPMVAASSSAASAVAESSAPATTPAVALSSPTVVTSTGAAAAAAMLFQSQPPAPIAVSAPSGPTPVQRLLEFDGKIIKLQSEISDKEATLTHEHDDADRGLLDVESRKTDQVLARLYRAVSEVARREGVSVVIDKASILYGQNAVDLTDKVLKYLKEASRP